MKIGVISDTHGMPGAWLRAMRLFEGADLIIHAGDVLYHPPRLKELPEYDLPELARLINESPIPVVITRGNCDSEVYEELLEVPTQSPYAVVQVEQTLIVVSHGHLLNHDEMIQVGKKYHASVFVSGHTHIPVIEKTDGPVLLNPGSAALPKYEINGVPTGSVGLITDGLVQVLSIEDGSVIFELPFS
ncbi:MAG: phosphodiesterase [Armatimonadota bacterium]|nr:phosphodiesterase [Armatimonadota bacterium]